MRRLTILVCLAAISPLTHAVPVTYDFTGTGYVTTYNGAESVTLSDASFTGWVTIDVLSPVGSVPGASIDPAGQWANALRGWVESDFFIDWGSGSFNPQPVEGQTNSEMRTTVYNSPSVDILENFEFYGGSVGSALHQSSAYLTRRTEDPTWLNSLEFDQTVGLAPGPGAVNHLSFRDFLFDNVLNIFATVSGEVDLNSFTQRAPTPVPEPGSLALFGLGFAGMALARRRRAA